MAISAIQESPAVAQRVRPTWRYWAIGTAILIAAGALRIAGAHNDPWLDEIWTLDLASQLQSPIEILTGLHHDNNHYLNTLWYWTVGPDGNWFEYRAAAILAGMGTVVVAGLIGARRDAATGLLAMLVFAVSYVMVLYSSEARGYATVCFFALLGYHSLERFFVRPAWTSALLYVISVVLGLLSQPIFIAFLAAGIVASFYWLIHPRLDRFVRGRLAPPEHAEASSNTNASKLDRQQSTEERPTPSILVALSLVAMQGVPMLVLVLLYLVDLRQLAIGGGAISKSLFQNYAFALAWALGTPLTGIPLAIGALAAAALGYAGLQLLYRKSPEQAVFFVGVIVFPVGLALMARSSVLYVRYFILSMEFLLLLMSFWLGALWNRKPRWQRAAVATILLAFCAINSMHLATLLRHGRGDTSGALRYMAARTEGPVIDVSADNSFRIVYPADYIARTAIPGKTIHFSRQGPWTADGPQWFICHKESYEPPVPYSQVMFGDAEHPYRLVATYPTAPLSGLHWFIYRRE